MADKDKDANLELTHEQTEALAAILAGHNVFITGGAGVGKTVLLKHAEIKLREQGKSVMICAPTGAAAIQVHGVTIHKALHLRWDPFVQTSQDAKLVDTLKVADAIIVDEISMCRFDLFEELCRYIRRAERSKGKKIQVIVSGDFFQLPPVLTDDEREILEQGWPGIDIGAGYAFQATSWLGYNFRVIELNEVIRQTDIDFVYHLNRLRLGDRESLDWVRDNASDNIQPGVYLYPRNLQANTKNQQELRKLKAPRRIFRAENVKYGETYPAEEYLALCVGARVMALVNDHDERYQNGSLGTVLEIDGTKVLVKFDNGFTAQLKPYIWTSYKYDVDDAEDGEDGDKVLKKEPEGMYAQIPLRVAYAMTIHKSQGQTYDSVNLDPSCFAPGQLYVALSRVRSIQSLHLMGDLLPRHLIVSEEVMDFYHDYHNRFL